MFIELKNIFSARINALLNRPPPQMVTKPGSQEKKKNFQVKIG